MSRVLRPAAARRLSIQALVVCLGALVAAGFAAFQGSWLGLVWLLMAGLTSNLAWYYHRLARPAAEAGGPHAEAAPDGAAPATADTTAPEAPAPSRQDG